MGKLDNKVAIITGGAGGIGFGAGKKFVDEGARVMLVDVDEARLAEAVQKLGSNVASFCVADVTSSADNEQVVSQTVEQFGGVDIFLANAGIEGMVTSIVDYDEEMFDKVMGVNVKGVWLGLKHVFPAMQARGGGSIVITSSIMGLKGGTNIAPYATSKHAVIGLMRSAALEGAPHNIRVNTVNPSPVETRMMRSLEAGMNPDDAEGAHAAIAANIPLGRYAEPEDIANVMAFLSSDDAAFLTGGIYSADGGSTAR